MEAVLSRGKVVIENGEYKGKAGDMVRVSGSAVRVLKHVRTRALAFCGVFDAPH